MDYTIGKARYAKGMLTVRCPSSTGYKTRAARLIGDGLKCRFSGREGAYIASPSKVRRFETLFANGWDASSFSGELIEPKIPGLADAAPVLFTDGSRMAFHVYKTMRALQCWVVIAAKPSITYAELQDGGAMADHAIDLRRFGFPDDPADATDAHRTEALRRALGIELEQVQ